MRNFFFRGARTSAVRPRGLARASHSLVAIKAVIAFAMPLAASAAAGDVDPAFGDSGVATMSAFDLDWGNPAGPVVQHDGRIVVCGVGLSADGSHYTTMLYRLTRDGAPDPEFGSAGHVDIGGGAITYTNCLALVGGVDDSIFALGLHYIGSPPYHDSETAILKFHADGTPDTSFGDGGVAYVDRVPGDFDAAQTALALADGSLMLGFSSYPNAFGAARLDAHGAIDTAFGDGGFARVEFDHTTDLMPTVCGVFIDAAGRIVLAGSLEDFPVPTAEFAAVRLAADGSVDRTFGSGGRVRVGFADRYSYPLVALLDDANRLVLAGLSSTLWSSGATPFSDVAVMRLRNDGALDSAFADGGKLLVPIDLGAERRDAIAFTGLLRRDGKILLAGTANAPYSTPIALLQLDPSGRLDRRFGDDGIRILDPVHSDAVSMYLPTGIAAQGSNDILIGVYGNGTNLNAHFALRLDGESVPRGHSQHRRPPRDTR